MVAAEGEGETPLAEPTAVDGAGAVGGRRTKLPSRRQQVRTRKGKHPEEWGKRGGKTRAHLTSPPWGC